jgi:hypothetical protein
MDITRARLFTCVLGLTLLFIAVFSSGCGSDSAPIAPADPGLLVSHELVATYGDAEFELVKTLELDTFLSGAHPQVRFLRVAWAS